MKYLYRGVNEEKYDELKGKLSPKKLFQKFSSHVCCDAPHASCGSGVTCGESNLNSVILHQWKQKGYPTSGISSTPHYERAKFYALHGGDAKKGYVFKLLIEALKSCGVAIYNVNKLINAPYILEDDEHILVEKNFGPIPDIAIVDILIVD